MVVKSRFPFLHSGLCSPLQVCGWFSLFGKYTSSSSCNVFSGVEVKLPSLFLMVVTLFEPFTCMILCSFAVAVRSFSLQQNSFQDFSCFMDCFFVFFSCFFCLFNIWVSWVSLAFPSFVFCSLFQFCEVFVPPSGFLIADFLDYGAVFFKRFFYCRFYCSIHFL